MLTPLDIQNKHFRKGLRGYNEVEVEEFLALIVRSMEDLIQVNIDTTAKIHDYEKQLERYQAMEKTINEAMILAQRTSEDMIKSANDKADFIIERADEQAKRMISDANNEVLNVLKRHEEAKHALQTFQMRFKVLVENQLKALEETANE
ncbi:DivIVA domain-containing protein [Fusibacter bizertensis]|uniref:DivIVA domain-containing protein n=1 Tax=Fusibacter bizertensis TaxID=1488331 RepID=A0ABT6N8F8_9FIRM|nr:DivIVA domain-containing protein [Fusibacter bizertensis]MDH8676700.1 DivIVA domain-containing protein [Fusibacter bizertensis]